MNQSYFSPCVCFSAQSKENKNKKKERWDRKKKSVGERSSECPLLNPRFEQNGDHIQWLLLFILITRGLEELQESDTVFTSLIGPKTKIVPKNPEKKT